MNNSQIAQAAPNVVIHDDKVRGLQLRTFPTKKVFYAYFRVRGTRLERRPKIGVWPTVSLASAREIAEGWIKQAAQGIDPIQDIEAKASRPTMAELATRYMERHGSGKKSSREDQRMIDQHILPKIGTKLVADITPTQIDDIHHGLKHIPTQANRVRSLLSKMFSLAEKWGMRPQQSNPCYGIERYKETKRKRYMTPDEAVAIEAELQRHAATAPAGVAFIYLLLYTGARKGEIAAAKWSWLEGNRLQLPDSKTGAKTIQLPPQAMEVISRLPKTNGTITGIASPRMLWDKICKDAGIKDLRIHDLRHSYASAALSAKLALEQIGQLLGHASPSTTKRYAHLMDEVAQAAAAKVADEIETMMKRKKETV